MARRWDLAMAMLRSHAERLQVAGHNPSHCRPLLGSGALCAGCWAEFQRLCKQASEALQVPPLFAELLCSLQGLLHVDLLQAAPAALPDHASCEDPARCSCECLGCKRVWWDAGRPQAPAGEQKRDIHAASAPAVPGEAAQQAAHALTASEREILAARFGREDGALKGVKHAQLALRVAAIAAAGGDRGEAQRVFDEAWDCAAAPPAHAPGGTT